MMSARALWRMVVLPIYVVLAGGVFSAAMARTSGSVIGGLAGWAPWALAVSAGLALLLVVGSILRWRRRLRCARRAIGRQRGRIEADRALATTRWRDGARSSEWMETSRG